MNPTDTAPRQARRTESLERRPTAGGPWEVLGAWTTAESARRNLNRQLDITERGHFTYRTAAYATAASVGNDNPTAVRAVVVH